MYAFTLRRRTTKFDVGRLSHGENILGASATRLHIAQVTKWKLYILVMAHRLRRLKVMGPRSNKHETFK